MRKSALARLIFFAILAVVLVGVLLAGIGFKLYSFTNAKYQKLEASIEAVQDGTENVIHGIPNSIDDILISWVSGSITLDTADVGEITITETGKDIGTHTMVLQHTDSRLMILYQDEDKGGLFNLFKLGGLPEKNLHITVPTNWTGKALVVDAASTRLAVTGVEIADVTVDGASADSVFRDCRVGKLEINGASGNVDFQGQLKKAEFSGASMNCNLDVRNIPNAIEMDAVSGDLTLTLPEDCGFTVEKDGLGGSFSSDFETKADDDRHTHGDGSCAINVDGVSSSVKILNSHEAAIAW